MRTVLLVLLFFPAVALAQSGGEFDLRHNVIAGGGLTFSVSGDYALGGTVGEASTGAVSGGGFVLRGGFWSASFPAMPLCFADCNDSGALTASDLGRINQTILKCAPCANDTPGGVAAGCAAIAFPGCVAADFNADGCIRAGELGRANQNLLKFQPSGCDPGTP